MPHAWRPLLLLVAAALVAAVLLPRAAAADPPHKVKRHHDVRHGHHRHYEPRGHTVRTLPRRHWRIAVRGKPYFYHRGLFYRPSGAEFVITAAPIGAIVSILPPGYVTLYFGAVPHYYANLTYYAWDSGASGYRVVEEPSDVGSAAAVPNELFVYPKEGQSEERLAKDRYECHRWAVDQTGYEPSAGSPLSEVTRAEYHRAMTACLEARAYSVK